MSSPIKGPLYRIERWPRGWIIAGNKDGVKGVPMSALDECKALFLGNASLHPGIVHHLNATFVVSDAVFCVGAHDELMAWQKEIEDRLAFKAPEFRWWYGCDVGLSSAAMFGVLCENPQLSRLAKAYGGGATPADADDFGRCVRLLGLFPEWRDRLSLVGAAYPNTRWVDIAAQWPALDEAYRAGADQFDTLFRGVGA